MGCGISVQKGKITDLPIPMIAQPTNFLAVEQSHDGASQIERTKSLTRKKSSAIQRSISFTKNIISRSASLSIPSPKIVSPREIKISIPVVSVRNDEEQDPLVPLFGYLYKLKLSNGSLEQVCPDTQQKIFLITPLDQEPEDITNDTGRRPMTEEPEELSDVDTSSVRASPVPSIDVTQPENIHQVDNWTSIQSIKYAPQIHSEKGSLMSSQKVSLYQDSPNNSQTGSKSLSRIGSQAQASAVIAAIEAAASRRATLKKDNTFHGHTASFDEFPGKPIKKATTVYQTNYISGQKSKRREELEEEFDKWAEDKGADDSVMNGSHPFKPIEEAKENQSTGSVNLLSNSIPIEAER